MNCIGLHSARYSGSCERCRKLVTTTFHYAPLKYNDLKYDILDNQDEALAKEFEESASLRL